MSAAEMETDEEMGLKIYGKLVANVLCELQLAEFDGGELRLKTSRALQIYHHMAKLYDLRDPLLALIRGETSAGLPIAYARAATAVHEELSHVIQSRPDCAKGKRVFGHREAVKFIALPSIPTSVLRTYTVVLPASVVGSNHQQEELRQLEHSGAVLIFSLQDLLPGAVAVVSPNLSTAELASQAMESPDTATQALTALLCGDAALWALFLRTHAKFLTEASARIIEGVTAKSKEVKSIPAGLVTPRKLTRPDTARGSEPAMPTSKTWPMPMASPLKPPESSPTGSPEAVTTPSADDGCLAAYSKLLAAICHEFELYADEETGWLEAKRQLLVYTHAARLAEERDAVVAAIKGEESSDSVQSLPESYRRAIESRRPELVADLAASGQKAKRIFSHEQVIQFHKPPKGLPVPRSSCIFLRERPQSSGDGHIRKRASIFRDLVRFRCPGNPLTTMESHGLALVFYLEDKAPKAFLVISPLFEQPELVERASTGTWHEIEQSLKEHLTSFIARESDAWRTFIQRHANVVSKDSLRIIQKVLKSCQPSVPSSIGSCSPTAFVAEELILSREQEAMGRAEAEARCYQADAHLAAEVEALAIAKDEMEAQKAEEIDIADRARSEAIAAMEISKEENGMLIDCNNEMLESLAKARKVAAIRLQSLATCRTKMVRMPLLKQELKKQERLSKEATARHAAELEALRTQLFRTQAELAEGRALVQSAKEAAREAQDKASKAQAALELKADTAKRLSDSNVSLRAEMAQAAAESQRAKTEASKTLEAIEALQKEFKTLETNSKKEIAELKKCRDALRAEMQESAKAFTTAAEVASKASEDAKTAKAAELKASAELVAQRGEAARLTAACTSLQVEAAKFRADAEAATKHADECRQAADRSCAELELKADMAARLQEANLTLRAANLSLSSKADEAHRAAEASSMEAAKARHETEEALLSLGPMKELLGQKEKELAETNALLEAARAKTAEISSTVKELEQKADEAQGLAAAAQSQARRAKADLNVQVAEVKRLDESCLRLRSEASVWKERAEAAEQDAAETQLKLKVALHASDLTEADVSRLARSKDIKDTGIVTAATAAATEEDLPEAPPEASERLPEMEMNLEEQFEKALAEASPYKPSTSAAGAEEWLWDEVWEIVEKAKSAANPNLEVPNDVPQADSSASSARSAKVSFLTKHPKSAIAAAFAAGAKAARSAASSAASSDAAFEASTPVKRMRLRGKSSGAVKRVRLADEEALYRAGA